MFNATIEDCWQEAIDFGWTEGTLNDVNFETAWYHKHFSEDTNNVAVFKVKENEALHTEYTYQGCISKRL